MVWHQLKRKHSYRNDSRAGDTHQKKKNPKFTKFFTPILTIYLYLELPDKSAFAF